MNDEVCPHGRSLGVACIFCPGGTARLSQRELTARQKSRVLQLAGPIPLSGPAVVAPAVGAPAASPRSGVRPPRKEAAYRRPPGSSKEQLTKDAAQAALARADAVDRERARRPRRSVDPAAGPESVAAAPPVPLGEVHVSELPPTPPALPAPGTLSLELSPVVRRHLEALLLFGASLESVAEGLLLQGLRANLAALDLRRAPSSRF